MDFEPHDVYMQQALELAQHAEQENEVPVGAIIVRGGKIIAAAYNQREQLKDPTAHAEMIAITQAANAIEDWRLEACTMYVTLEPCPMCAGAIVQSRIPNVVFGASDPKAGAAGSMFNLLNDQRLNHCCHVTGGVLAQRSADILTRFFQRQRELGKK